MTSTDRKEHLVRETMALVAALAGGSVEDEPQPAFSAAEWAEWYALVEVHGLAPGLSRLLELGRWSGLPAELAARCRREYTAQTVRHLAAFRQFQEIRELLREAGIPVIPLKGLAFSRSLYADPAVRQFGDLDLLVPEAAGPRAVALLETRGYARIPAFTSAEEELLHARQAHFCPLVRPGALPVEVHTQVLKDRGDASRAREAAWAAAAPDERGLLQLDLTHATVLAAAHYATHLRLGAGHLKWLVDLLLLLRDAPSPAALLETAERWSVRETVTPLLAAAGAYSEGPLLQGFAVEPLPAEYLVYSPLEAGSRGLVSAANRLGSLRELPGPASRARYLLRLLFPSAEHLRYRYQVPPGRSIQTHRFMHPWRLAARLLSSVRSRPLEPDDAG